MDFSYSVTFERASVQSSFKLNEIFSLHFKERVNFDGGKIELRKFGDLREKWCFCSSFNQISDKDK